MATFPVDDVTPAVSRLPERPLADLFPDALAVGGDLALRVLEPDGVHPLLSAVSRAFADHRPLVLSPDAVWLTIAQGVAQHIRLHAEELRPRLVRHTGRRRLTVTVHGGVPRDAAGWADATGSFAKLLAAEIDDADLFECDFSTSTDVERTAGRIVLLDAYSPYFAYWMTAICGIPSVTVTGTVEDWRRIRARVDALPGFGLATWCRSLAPIADEFVRAAAGQHDRDFWRRIYNPIDAYGGDVITGWITRLYPYLKDATLDRPNRMLELPIGEPRGVTTTPGGTYQGPGVRSTEVPAVLSRVVVNVNDRAGGDNRAVALHGGLVGVAQDPGGALRPVAGWHLAPAAVEMDDVIDRLEREHDTAPPAGECEEGSAEVLALYARVGTAVLFGGAWRLLPAGERCFVDTGNWDVTIDTMFELADGRTIASAVDRCTETTHWVLCRVVHAEVEEGFARRARLAEDPADVPVLGTSLAMLLDAALDAGGDVAHLETGRLAWMLRPRGVDALSFDESGTVRGILPPGPLVFPVDPDELMALDAAVRAAKAEFRHVPGATPGAPWTAALDEHLARRLPAFVDELLAERTAVTAETLAPAADALGVPLPELLGRLRPVELFGRLEIPQVTWTTLTAAAARLTALDALGAPAAVLESVRRHALAVCTAGWRPTIDPAAWIPDPVEVAAAVDVDRWPTRPPVVHADMSDLVLLAVLCAVGPGTRAVAAGPAASLWPEPGAASLWRELGGADPEVDHGPLPDGTVVVGLSVHRDRVRRLEFALLPDSALLAVTFIDADTATGADTDAFAAAVSQGGADTGAFADTGAVTDRGGTDTYVDGDAGTGGGDAGTGGDTGGGGRPATTRQE
jgi:hypothetical protein